MNKKCIAVVSVLFAAVFAVAASWAASSDTAKPPASAQAQGSAGAAPQASFGSEGDTDSADVVVLLDVSQSALPYFQDVTDFVVGSVVKDYLRRGDTFHLLSFGEIAQSEIAQRMVDESDVKSVLGRLYLLYPIARYSDIVGALNYLYQYLADLPESRRKVVIVITDGMHNPPPSSPTYGMEPAKISEAIESASSKIRANGWPVHIIKLPFPKPGERGVAGASDAEAQGVSYLDAMAKDLGAEVAEFSPEGKANLARRSLALPSVVFPGPLGKRDYAFSFPIKIDNGADAPVGLELDRVVFGGSDILSKKVFLKLPSGRSGTMDIPILVPDSVPQGDSRLEVSLHFANGVRVSPDSGVLALTLDRSPLAALLRSGGRVVLFIAVVALLLGAVLALVMIVRRMPRRAEAPVVAAVLADAQSGTASTAAAAEAVPASSGAAEAASARKPARVGRVAPAAAAAPSPVPGTGGGAARAAFADGAARSVSSAAARTAAAESDAESLAAEARNKANQSAALLADAAKAKAREASAAKAEEAAVLASAPGAPGIPQTVAKRGRWLRKLDDREKAAAAGADAIIRQRKEESERVVALLASASRRRVPAKRADASDIAKARAAAAAHSPRIVKPGSIPIEFIVADQNPHIGSRNVHTIGAGGSKTVGGGSSDFLIFLVSVPRKVAELHFDGEKLCFVPLRPELFPELSGPVEDCLGKDIPMISKSGYPLSLRFAVYEKPADKINKLLHCIEAPGLA